MSTNTCIYRHINTSRCCCFKTRNTYCNLHTNNRSIVYEIINNAIDNKNIITCNDIYKIFISYGKQNRTIKRNYIIR